MLIRSINFRCLRRKRHPLGRMKLHSEHALATEFRRCTDGKLFVPASESLIDSMKVQQTTEISQLQDQECEESVLCKTAEKSDVEEVKVDKPKTKPIVETEQKTNVQYMPDTAYAEKSLSEHKTDDLDDFYGDDEPLEQPKVEKKLCLDKSETNKPKTLKTDDDLDSNDSDFEADVTHINTDKQEVIQKPKDLSVSPSEKVENKTEASKVAENKPVTPKPKSPVVDAAKVTKSEVTTGKSVEKSEKSKVTETCKPKETEKVAEIPAKKEIQTKTTDVKESVKTADKPTEKPAKVQLDQQASNQAEKVPAKPSDKQPEKISNKKSDQKAEKQIGKTANKKAEMCNSGEKEKQVDVKKDTDQPAETKHRIEHTVSIPSPDHDSQTEDETSIQDMKMLKTGSEKIGEVPNKTEKMDDASSKTDKTVTFSK